MSAHEAVASRRTTSDLAGQVALITGAAHGQGRASALALAREGVQIAALDVARPMTYPGYPMGSVDDLETLARECRALGVDCLTFAADVRDDVAVSAAVRATADHFGGIDILFNNAGICGYGLAHELTEDAWDSMLDINLKGPWIVARHVIPIMIERRRGVIINNASVAGLRGMARLSHYAASKWGLVGLTKSWAIELASYNIRVVALCPTGVNTPMNDGLAMLEGKPRARSPNAPRATSSPCPGSSPRTWPERSCFWPRRKRGRSPARNSSSTRGCLRQFQLVNRQSLLGYLIFLPTIQFLGWRSGSSNTSMNRSSSSAPLTSPSAASEVLYVERV